MAFAKVLICVFLSLGVIHSPLPPDCLVLLVFKDKSDKAQGHKEKASVTLEEICGLEAGQWYEGVAFTLVILCLNQAALLGFDSREALQAWDARLRYSLGEGERICWCFDSFFILFSTFFVSSLKKLPVTQHFTKWHCI